MKNFLQTFRCLERESKLSLSRDRQAGDWPADLFMARDLKWELNPVLLHGELQITTTRDPDCSISRQKHTIIFLKKHIGFSINDLFPRARIEPRSPAPPTAVQPTELTDAFLFMEYCRDASVSHM